MFIYVTVLVIIILFYNLNTGVGRSRALGGGPNARYARDANDQHIGHSCPSKVIMGVLGAKPLEAIANEVNYG